MRTLLLLASCGAAILLIETQRGLRGSPGPTSGAARPAGAERSGPADPQPAPAPLPSIPRSSAAPGAEAVADSPLDAMERSLLREAHEEWRAPAGALLDRALPAEDGRAVAIATLRAALRQNAERRSADGAAGTGGGPLRARLSPSATIPFARAEWRGDRLTGTAFDGTALAIPAAEIRSLEPIAPDEARALLRAIDESEIAALRRGGAAGLTAALERVIGSGDLARAEESLPEWLSAGGPAFLAAAEGEPARRARLERCVALLTASPATASAALARPREGPRDLPGLIAFLESPISPRDLSPDERAARALESGLWSDWLAAEGDRVPLPAAERARLDQRLRLLRHDLLKGSGF